MPSAIPSRPIQRLRTALAAAAGLVLWTNAAFAADKITFLTSWFAQAEHGGFYQAKATGLYEKAGLDVVLKMGGPQINGMQLLLGGETDVMMGYDLQVLKALEQGLPVITIATSFQYDLQGMMTHPDVNSLADLKDKTILVATPGRSTWWPWLKAKYKYTEEQTRPYTFNLQPFFADKNLVQQAYPTSEPFAAKQAGIPAKYFLFADYGYPPYGTTMVATQPFVDKHPDAVARFVKASLEGWRSYLHNPAPGNALIKVDNPRMSDEQIAFAVEQLKAIKVLEGGDAATLGIGIMTEARWKATYDFAVATGLLALTGQRPGPTASAPAVEVLSAEKIFPNGTRALAPIALTVAQGEFVTLIGPSGCGKSTLLKLMANLLEPSDGRLLWWRAGYGDVVSHGRQVAFVFQDPTLMPWARVAANVRLPLDLAGTPRAAADARVAAALARVGLTDFARHYPRQLSGGMKMRASIARSLVIDPDLLLMDEPFGALDEFTRNRLDDDLVTLCFERKLTTVFVTHSIYEAVFLSSRVIVMASAPGRIFATLAIDEPQPRAESFRNSARFAEYCRTVSGLLAKASGV
jgi:NitT/TauT family transport system substrate-binding protein